jgi:hypothetical protein
MKNLFSDFPEACELALELPVPNEKVVVVGPGFKTIGYVDKKGTWRQYFDDTLLEDVVDWFSLK